MWFRYMEPVISTIAVLVWCGAYLLLVGAVMGAGFVGVLWFVYQYI